ncbi:MAG: ImmA/IrrE family metallo-endopeptidase [Oscillospiraceae bacterium]|nr:ImmA/IrrE family metallo-endopeptidase [Oscillospiraceae bacterium]
MEYTYLEAERVAMEYDTRNPYELLECIGAHLEISYAYTADGLKGFSAIFNRTMYALVNGKLNEHEQRIVAGHEEAHLILHKAEILQYPGQTMRDFELYSETSRLEYQANHFLADFLVSDEQVLDVASGKRLGYFHTASALYMPPPLLAFKLHSMIERGLSLWR